ncbi:hypothetical protein NXV60_16265 [Bacteroides fragilis]|nr:hypothetical protein NXV60_16265 [Bacteroides fragilis]
MYYKKRKKSPGRNARILQITSSRRKCVWLWEMDFLDEQGNETNYLSFDVFMGRSAKSRNVDLTPNVAYLYKDLSEYYKNKYPQAGVKTVVVSYAISIK